MIRLRPAIALAVVATLGVATVTTVVVPQPASAAPSTVTRTFGYSASVQTFTVPTGITELTVTLTGGEGGRGGKDGPDGLAGGYKGVVTGTVPVTPGAVLQIGVGGGGVSGTMRAGTTNSTVAPAGTNALGGYAGGAGGLAGPGGSSGNGGGGGGATVVTVDATTIVAGGAGGGGGSGRWDVLYGRAGEATTKARTDATSTTGQPGADTQSFCGTGNCDGGASGGGGGGAQGGARGLVEFGTGTYTEYFGYGGYPGSNATGGIASLSAQYQYYSGNNTAGSVVISYVTGAPAAPTAVTGTAGNASVDLVWVAPTSSGGSAVTDYVIEYAPSGTSNWTTFADGSSTLTRTTVTGLTNGTAYVFRVSAVNSFGTGTASAASAAITPSDVPTAPSIVSMTPADGRLSVAVTGASAASPITGYQYSVDGGPWVDAGTAASPVVVTGLTNGISTSIRVRAVNAIGPGAPSAPATGTASTTPAAPAITSAVTGATDAVIEFEPGANGGLPITGYEYRLGSGPWVATTGTASPFTVGGLSDGTSYSLTLRAVNASGEGPASRPASFTTAAVPAAPTISSVTALDTALSVAFVAPRTGGLAITGYEYQVDAGAWTAVPGGASPLVLTGLTNGVDHSVRVRAVNSVGTGAPSAPATGRPLGAPGAPTITAQTLDTGANVVAFTPPASSGGTPVTGYEYSTDGGLTWAGRTDGQTTASPMRITTASGDGSTLDPVAYPIQLRALNAVGAGPASGLADTGGAVAPAAPVITSLTPQAGALGVVIAPGANGGSAITGYEYRLDGGAWQSTGSTATSFVIGGLTNGTAYAVEVRAVNAVGEGAPSALASGTPATVPGVPTVSAVVPVSGALQLAVAAADGGSAITAWEYTTDGGATWAAATGTGLLTVSALSNGGGPLTNGTTYAVAVRAVNGVGVGASSDTVSGSPSAVPAAPVAVLTPGNRTLSVAYTIASDGGSPVTAVEYRLDAGAWVDAGSTASPFVISGLTNGTAHTVELRAANSRGVGAVSAPVTGTPRTVPGPPTGVTTTAASSSASVSWLAPASDGGSAVTGYTATAWSSANGGTAVGTCTTTGALTCSIGGLVNLTTFYVDVQARNAAGAGSVSTPRAAVTPVAPPAAPTLTSVTPANTFVTAAFTAGAAGSYPITGYQYQLNGGAWVNASGTTSPVTISGLVNGTSYAVALRAVSAAGAGAASNTLTAVPYTLPNVPDSSEITPTGASGSVTVTWAAPASNGRPITAYGVVLWSAATLGSQVASCTTTGATSCVITGLTNGTVYWATVDATNLAGTTARSAPRIPTAAGTAPGAPTITTATAGDGSVALAWTAGAAGTGAAVNDYEIAYSTDGGLTYTRFPDATSTVRSATVTGLTNGTPYMFHVRALSPSGASAYSAVAGPATPLGAGTAPVLGAPTRTADGFTVPITNIAPGTTYAVSTTAGTATVSGGVVTVTGLTPGQSATVTVTAQRPGSTDAAAAATGTALNAGIVPVLGTPTRTADGFTVAIDNATAGTTYAVSTTAGTATVSGGVVTVSGLTPGQSATVTVTAQRPGSTDAAAAATGTALLTGVTPVLATPTRTADGFTVAIDNAAAGTTYAVSTTAGTATVSGGVVTVTGLTPGQSATVTVTAERPGATDAAAAASGTALLTGVTPILGAPTRTADGFTVPITNIAAGTTYTVSTTAGTATVSGGVVTVTGLTPGQTATVTVTAQRPGATDAAASASGTALDAGIAPTFGTPTRTADGFTVAIDNADAGTTYTVTTTAGVATVSGGVVTVTGLSPGQTATVTVTAQRPGFTDAEATGTEAALLTGVTPILGAPTSTADGFTVAIDNAADGTTYTVSTTAGIATVSDGVVTVTGLTPDQTATVTVTAQRPGFTDTAATASGTALLAGVTPVLGTPTRTADGFTVAIDNAAAGTAYAVSTTAGTATVSGGVITVTGLTPGQTATVTVTAQRPGATDAAATASGTALDPAAPPVVTPPTTPTPATTPGTTTPTTSTPTTTPPARTSNEPSSSNADVATTTADGSTEVIAPVAGGPSPTGSATGAPTVTVTGGGPDGMTESSATPTIRGTSDAAPGSPVTVVVGGQRLSTIVGTDGTWAVTPARLDDGTYEMTVTVESAGQSTTVTQMLTIASVTDAGPSAAGIDALLPVMILIALLVLGGAGWLLWAAARRRRREEEESA